METTLKNVGASYIRAQLLLRSCALTLFALTSPLFAADLQPVPASQQPGVWSEFDTAQRGFTNFVAEVVQTKTLQIFQKPVVSRAKLWFARPNLFRWEVTNPGPSLTVSDGKWLWMYYPEFQQAEKYLLNDPRLGSSPMKAMSASMGENPAALTNSCNVTVFASQQMYRLEAVPRDPRERQFLAKLVLDFDRKSFVLTRAMMESSNGDQTENRFTSSQVNQPIGASLFHFQPPQNVRVVSPLSK